MQENWNGGKTQEGRRGAENTRGERETDSGSLEECRLTFYLQFLFFHFFNHLINSQAQIAAELEKERQEEEKRYILIYTEVLI